MTNFRNRTWQVDQYQFVVIRILVSIIYCHISYAFILALSSNVRLKSALLVGPTDTSLLHLWNPIGFPSIYVDEAHYMRESMNLLEGQGPRISKNI